MQHNSSYPAQPDHVCRRRLLPGFLRSVSPAAVAVTLSLLIGGAGFADAATGGTFLLGKVNKETSTATLSDSRGAPLALAAPAGKAPLAVNRNVMVKNLNAQYLGGLTATRLAVTGGEGVTVAGSSGDTKVGTTPVVVASTGKLPAGTYYVSATASLDIIAGGLYYPACYIIKASDPSTDLNEAVAPLSGESSVAETAAATLTAGDRLEEVCFAATASFANDAGIIAIRVLSSSHT